MIKQEFKVNFLKVDSSETNSLKIDAEEKHTVNMILEHVNSLINAEWMFKKYCHSVLNMSNCWWQKFLINKVSILYLTLLDILTNVYFKWHIQQMNKKHFYDHCNMYTMITVC